MQTPISIHALHEESDQILVLLVILEPISIHALHEESDQLVSACRHVVDISIHALHEESDRQRAKNLQGLPYFNPRSP